MMHTRAPAPSEPPSAQSRSTVSGHEPGSAISPIESSGRPQAGSSWMSGPLGAGDTLTILCRPGEDRQCLARHETARHPSKEGSMSQEHEGQDTPRDDADTEAHRRHTFPNPDEPADVEAHGAENQ